MSGLFEKHNIDVNDFQNWLRENEKKNKPNKHIQSFRNDYYDLRERMEPGDNEKIRMFNLYKKDRKKEKEIEDQSQNIIRAIRDGYRDNIEDDKGNVVYQELGIKGIKGKKGGKRKRKTLKRKRSKKTKNNKKSRKSKRKMTRRRR